MIARAAACAFRVVVGILVKRNGVERVQIAEYVATSSAVMTAREVGEVSCAGWIVTDGRVGIRLRIGMSV